MTLSAIIVDPTGCVDLALNCFCLSVCLSVNLLCCSQMSPWLLLRCMLSLLSSLEICGCSVDRIRGGNLKHTNINKNIFC